MPAAGHAPTAENAPKKTVVKRIPVEELKYFVIGIFSGLRQRSLTDGQVTEAFASHLTATCSQCGLIFSGRELAQIAAGQELDYKKVSEISRGRCPKKSCGSSSYDVAYRVSETIPWLELVEEAETAARAAYKGEQQEPETGAVILDDAFRPYKIALALVFSLIAISLLYWRCRTPSWSSGPSKYQVEPDIAPSANPDH